MPTIILEGPKVEDLDKKRKLISACADAAAEYFGIPKSYIGMVIHENTFDNQGSGGAMVSDLLAANPSMTDTDH